MYDLAIYILVLPALAALINGLFGHWLKEKAGYVACAAMLGTLAITAWLFFFGNVPPEGVRVPLYEWMASGNLSVSAELWLDPLTMVMLWVVSFVGSLVFIYSIGYMHGDPGQPRFFAYLSLFALSMYLLVLGANFLMLFIGWEGVGLCSYLLIGYYFDQPFDEEISCADAGKKAFIVNRIGDFGFLLGMIFIFTYFGTLDFQTVFSMAPGLYQELGDKAGLLFTGIALLLFVGATGKSAQIPLFIWLPDAMAGPTPVSALIHAATMVTAGVYMVARCNVLFDLAPTALMVVAVIGAATAFVAASIGITQRDIKKVLAYSTVSQLGYMFLACGMGAYAVGIFHVFTHAFFKGCLFLCAGSVIHAMGGQQDMTKMGGLKEKMPITWWTYGFATLAIAGIIPFAGFWSKDEILWKAVSHGDALGKLLWLVGIAAALMTSFYMFRSLFMTFYGATRADEETWNHVHESPKTMTVPLMILAIGSLVVGFFGLPAYTHMDNFQQYLHPVTHKGAEAAAIAFAHAEHASEHAVANAAEAGHGEEGAHGIGHVMIEIGFALLSLIVAATGIVFATSFYLVKFPDLPQRMAGKYPALYRLSFNLWYYNRFCMNVIVGGAMGLYKFILLIDEVIVDGVVNSVGRITKMMGQEFRRMQTSQTQGYALWVLVGVNLIILIFILYTF